jgi:hypothetical protein
MQFHKDIGAGVLRFVGRTGQVAKAELLVEVDGGCGFGVRFKIEATRPHDAGHADGEVEQFAADAGVAGGFRNGHLGELEFSRRYRDERTAADGLTTKFGDTNLTAGTEDVRPGVVEQHTIRGLNHIEIFADPVFIEAKEGGFVARAKGAERDAVRVRLRHRLRLARGGRKRDSDCSERSTGNRQ